MKLQNHQIDHIQEVISDFLNKECSTNDKNLIRRIHSQIAQFLSNELDWVESATVFRDDDIKVTLIPNKEYLIEVDEVFSDDIDWVESKSLSIQVILSQVVTGEFSISDYFKLVD